MNSIYVFENYKSFINEKIKSFPKQGYGVARRLAQNLKIHPTFVSQVLNGTKHFSTEQCIGIGNFFSLTQDETEYLLTLVHLDRAGDGQSREFFMSRKKMLLSQQKNLSSKISFQALLSPQQQAVFYSHWAYSAIRQIFAIKKSFSIEEISQRFRLPPQKVSKIISYLLSTNLIIKVDNGYAIGPASTHIEASSPWYSVYHTNWRHQGMAKVPMEDNHDLFLTCPATLSAADFQLIRTRITKMIQEIFLTIDGSISEELYCLNIDWFKV